MTNNKLQNNTNLFDSFFDNIFNVPSTFDFGKSAKFMKTDIVENEKDYNLKIDLPGFTKEQISIELDSGYITISAEKNENNDEKADDSKFIRRERFFESSKRSFYIGDDVTENDIEAKLENGTLEIVIPKKAPQIPEKKLISIK